MEDKNQQIESGLAQLKARLDEEFHQKVQLEEQDKVIWNPAVMRQKLKRSTSFVCSDYHNQDSDRPKPKTVTTNPWQCQSQAMRQLSLVPRFGPKPFYINNTMVHNINKTYLSGSSTQAFGLCYEPKTVGSL